MDTQSIVYGITLLLLTTLGIYGWATEQKRRRAEDKALDYKNQLETMEAIEKLKIKATTDERAADEVNKAWDPSSSSQ
jgi:hypothetical protein